MNGLEKIDKKYRGVHMIQKKVCMTKDIGIHGNLFGGTLLSWIDESAASFLSEAVGFGKVVTLKIEEVLFKSSVKVHDIVNIDGVITKVGKSSIRIDITVLNTKTNEIVLTTRMIFVNVDDNMRPKEIG